MKKTILFPSDFPKVLPEGFVSMTFVLQYYFKCLLVYISFILFFFSYNDSFLNICYSFAMTINNVFFIYLFLNAVRYFN